MAFDRARASTITRIVTGIDPGAADGMSKAFRQGASECLLAAERLDDGFADLTPEYIVLFHAIELGLKAFLLKPGLPTEKLRKKPFGHDLVQLYAEAKRRGMSLAISDADELISWINEWHDDVKIRYEFANHRTLPICKTLFPLTAAIINSSDPRCQPAIGGK
jgi:hypothetical protein